MPADTLVYLETNDLAAALQPVIDSKPFSDVAKSKPDVSALKGVQIGVAVTGFETSEEKLTDDTSVGRVQPHFVAVADTHAWNFQAVKFAEQKLGSLVTRIYDSEPKVETADKKGGKYFTWTADDGRKAYALVIDSLIYFGNDESAIDKCLAIRRGEGNSLASTGKAVSPEPQTLVRGYISTDGIGQIANLVAMQIAVASDEDSDVRSYIVSALPELIRSSASEINWTSVAAQPGIEDRFTVLRPQQPPQNRKEMLSLSRVVELLFEEIEGTTAEEIVPVIAEPRADAASGANVIRHREDRFTSTTSERRLTSDFGFIGWLIAQLDED